MCAIYFPLGKRFLCDKNENCVMLKDVFLNTCSNRMVPICLFLKRNYICKATLLRLRCNFVFLLHLTASLASVSVSFVTVRLNVSLIVLGEYLYCFINNCFKSFSLIQHWNMFKTEASKMCCKTGVGVTKRSYMK